MPKLRLKIVKQRAKNRPSHARNLLHSAGRLIQEKINMILDSDVLPLIIAPSIFMIFAGLEWWRWYLEIPSPSPIFLTVIAIGLGLYCSYKLMGYKKHEDERKTPQTPADPHSELRQEKISNIS